MSNKKRGEISIKLHNKEFILRPSFQALSSIESSLGKSLVTIISNLGTESLTISEMATIIYHSIKEETALANSDEIGNLIVTTGTIKILPKLVEFLEYAIGLKG